MAGNSIWTLKGKNNSAQTIILFCDCDPTIQPIVFNYMSFFYSILVLIGKREAISVKLIKQKSCYVKLLSQNWTKLANIFGVDVTFGAVTLERVDKFQNKNSSITTWYSGLF